MFGGLLAKREHIVYIRKDDDDGCASSPDDGEFDDRKQRKDEL